VHVLANEPLQQRNTLALKSSASAFVSASTENELVEALGWAEDHCRKVITLGEGSNVVLAGDLHALVIHQTQRGIEILDDAEEAVLLRVAAGENWHALVQWTLARGYFGLENLALIPGTMGAAPIQNIGAYGVELAPFVQRVFAIRVEDGKPLELTAKECEFGYRDSVFKQALRDRVVITSVDLLLPKNPALQLSYPALKDYLESSCAVAPTPQLVFDAVVNIRRSRLPDPGIIPNAGSFFKNPVISQGQLDELREHAPNLPSYPQSNEQVKLPAAWLIDQCGWKGKRLGGYGVHPEHALVLVNHGGDNGTELLELARQISSSVDGVYGIKLEIEPRVYGLE
jgi:UDP-N-acetylmuramate dehydrogenase